MRSKIGTRVQFELVRRVVQGVIVDELGRLGTLRGSKRQRVFAVQVEYDSSEPMIYMLEESDFEEVLSSPAKAA